MTNNMKKCECNCTTSISKLVGEVECNKSEPNPIVISIVYVQLKRGDELVSIGFQPNSDHIVLVHPRTLIREDVDIAFEPDPNLFKDIDEEEDKDEDEEWNELCRHSTTEQNTNLTPPQCGSKDRNFSLERFLLFTKEDLCAIPTSEILLILEPSTVVKEAYQETIETDIEDNIVKNSMINLDLTHIVKTYLPHTT